MPHLRVELVDIHSRDTEDMTGADELYLVGGIVVGTGDELQRQGILTRPLSINDGETKEFGADEILLFDGEVSADSELHLGITVYDQDTLQDWSRYPEARQAITNSIDDSVESSELIDQANTALPSFFGLLDLDDRLGELALDLAVADLKQGKDGREWQFAQSSFGESTWDYTIRYNIDYSRAEQPA